MEWKRKTPNKTGRNAKSRLSRTAGSGDPSNGAVFAVNGESVGRRIWRGMFSFLVKIVTLGEFFEELSITGSFSPLKYPVFH